MAEVCAGSVPAQKNGLENRERRLVASHKHMLEAHAQGYTGVLRMPLKTKISPMMLWKIKAEDG